jgi:hypothetical protein
VSPIDELELELRQLPGVGFVGAVETPGGLVIQLGIEPVVDHAWVLSEARRLAELHVAGPFRIELTILGGGDVAQEFAAEPGPRGARRGRVQLLVVLPWPERQEVEVHLAHEGRRTVGRAPTGGLEQVAVATLRALDALGRPAPFQVRAASRLEQLTSAQIGPGVADVVGVALDADPAASASGPASAPETRAAPGAVVPAITPRFGASAGRTPEEAAARATLHAVNRYLDPIS